MYWIMPIVLIVLHFTAKKEGHLNMIPEDVILNNKTPFQKWLQESRVVDPVPGVIRGSDSEPGSGIFLTVSSRSRFYLDIGSANMH